MRRVISSDLISGITKDIPSSHTEPTLKSGGHKFFGLLFARGSLLSAMLLSGAAYASAAEIAVHDCSGNLRWISDLGQDEASLDIAVTVPESEASQLRMITLTEQKGLQRKPAIRGFEASFSSVTPGQWKLCGPDGRQVQFTAVGRSGGGGGNSMSWGMAAGGITLASLGATAWGTSSGSSSSGRDSSQEFGVPDEILTEPVSPSLPAVGDDFDPSDFKLGAPAAPLSPYS